MKCIYLTFEFKYTFRNSFSHHVSHRKYANKIRKRKCDRQHEQDLSYRAGIPTILSLNLDQVIKMSTAMFVSLSRRRAILERILQDKVENDDTKCKVKPKQI